MNERREVFRRIGSWPLTRIASRGEVVCKFIDLRTRCRHFRAAEFERRTNQDSGQGSRDWFEPAVEVGFESKAGEAAIAEDVKAV
jgi:hypothetical protein